MKKMYITMAVMAVASLLPMIAQATPLPPESVPEPSTVFAGAMLLAPFGVMAVRALRKNRK